MSDKCPYHDDYMRHLEKQDGAIERADRKAQKALDKVDTLEGAHKETEVYTKELYKTVDRVITKVDSLTDQVASLVTALSVNKAKMDSSSGFINRMKNLVYEIIKYVVLLVIAYFFVGSSS